MCDGQAQTLGVVFRVLLEIWVHVLRIPEITRIAHHVISNPHTIHQSLPIAQPANTTLRHLHYDISTSTYHPTLIFGMWPRRPACGLGASAIPNAKHYYRHRKKEQANGDDALHAEREGQRREPAGGDARNATRRAGWRPFAGPAWFGMVRRG